MKTKRKFYSKARLDHFIDWLENEGYSHWFVVWNGKRIWEIEFPYDADLGYHPE